MNKKIYLLLCVLLAWSFNLKAQTAQIGSVTANPGDAVSFDINVADFPGDVGAISLFIGYDPNVLTFNGASDGTISGFIVNNMTGVNKVGIQWTEPNLTGQAIDGVLLTLNFTYNALGGVCDLTFDGGCDFSDINLNSITVAYTNGNISPNAGLATITIGDSLAAPGPISMNVDAANLPADVAAMSFNVQYDNSVLSFDSYTSVNLAGKGSLTVNAANGTIRIAWFDFSQGWDLNGTLLQLNFTYSSGSSALTFVDDNTNPVDISTYSFVEVSTSFNSGSVSSATSALSLKIEDVTALPGQDVSFDLTSAGFTDPIGSVSLSIGFDPNSLTFMGVTPGDISPIANVSSPGVLSIQWYDNNGVSLTSVLMSLNFHYNVGQGPVVFNGGCEIADPAANVLPVQYIDGSITQGIDTTMAVIPSKTGTVGQTISFPVLVSYFPANTGAISLFIGYDSGVLQYDGTTPGTISGYFANNMVATSQVGVQWYNTAGMDISPNPGDTLLMLNFTYLGGVCDITFDNGCEFAENDLDPIYVSYFNGGVVSGTKLNIKVFLEGPFSGGTMTTALTTGGYIPLAQPYNVAPWNYSGTENVSTMPPNAVDWVLVQMRETTGGAASATSGTVVGTRAGLLLSDGTIVDVDGSSELFFPQVITNNLFVVVYHRNHLGAMSSVAVTETAGVYTYDFTVALGNAYNNGLKALTGGVFGLYAADGDANGLIQNQDKIIWLGQFGNVGYKAGDYDLNGLVQNQDKIKWLSNFGQATQIP